MDGRSLSFVLMGLVLFLLLGCTSLTSSMKESIPAADPTVKEVIEQESIPSAEYS